MNIRTFPAIAILSLSLGVIPAYQKLESHLTQQPQQKAHDDGNHENDDHDDQDDHNKVDEHESEQAEHHELSHKILVTSPIAKGVSITQQYVC